MGGFLFASALRDYLRPSRLVAWGAAALGVFGIGVAWVRLGGKMAPDQAYGQLASLVVYRVLALASAVFSTMVVGQEVEQRTIVYLLTRPAPRAKVLLARFLASAVAATLAGWACAVAAGLSVYGLGAFGRDAFLWDLLLVPVGSLAYGALFVWLSLVVNRALVWCLLFAFGWESFVPNLSGSLFYASVLTYIKALSHHPKPSEEMAFLNLLAGQLGGGSVSPALAWVATAGIVAAFVGLACWWFRHFEFTPREDVE